MKKILLSFWSAFFIISISFPQSDYYDYNTYTKSLIFFDDFDNNNSGWEINSRQQIIDGEYFVSESNYFPDISTINIDQSKDFEIETCFRINIESSYNCKIIWGQSDINHFYSFGYNSENEYYFCKYNIGETCYYLKEHSKHIIQNDYNKLTIRKVDGIYYLFINEVFLKDIKAEDFFGQNISFCAATRTSINVKYIKISYLKPPYTFEYFDESDKTDPEITITYPKIYPDRLVYETNKEITITGKASDANGILRVLVDGKPANIDADGNFSRTVSLDYGENSFTVIALDLSQNFNLDTFMIIRQSKPRNNNTTAGQAVNANNLKAGNYYALIIGNNDYQDPAIFSLDEPVKDATKLYNVLTTKYNFEAQNITFLKNASYVQMIEALDNLSNLCTENDNLLVFYAGHGWWDEEKQLGYWLPVDAKKKNTAFWIRNSTISDYMGSIKAKHTLLIADACFSGSIFKTRAAFDDAGQGINSLYQLPSRTAMTSGNLKEVPDKSVFLQYLVKRLEENTEKYLSADQLFVSFRIAVMNNSRTEPQFGTIQNTGDEGGEFIFIQK